MLTSCKLTGSPESISAYHTAEENYYFAQADGVESLAGDGGAQSHVRIYGILALRLGFAEGATLTQEAFTNLLDGKDGAGRRVTRPHKVNGIDLTFSAPKSVSLAGLLTIRDPQVIEAHDRAVLDTMREIERHCAGTQPKAGSHEHTGNLAFVTVRDGFNRDHDPHLHTHVVIPNMTAYGERILALDGRRIMMRDFNKLWGAMYRARLAERLSELGYSVSYTKKGELRLDAVSLEIERAFSGRSLEIRAKKDAGLGDMEAWRKSRKEKDPAVRKSEILESWRERLGAFQEKSAAETRAETIKERDAWYEAARWSVEARQEMAGERVEREMNLWQVAARRATDRSACASEQAVITEYLAERGRTELWRVPDYADLKWRLDRQVEEGHLVRTKDGHYTTWEMMRADRECVASYSGTPKLVMAADAAREKVRAYSVARETQGHRTLSERQAQVAAAILAGSSGIVVVQGDAGSGKTTMLGAVNEVSVGLGWDVVGVAVQGVAARNLEQESGIRSTTLASYIAQERAHTPDAQRNYHAPERPARLIVVDEASMLDSRVFAELLYVAERGRDKLVLVGDRNQLQAVGAGKPFERRVEAAEKDGTLLNLNENYRQRDPELRKAVELAREGKAREAIDFLDSLGKVNEIWDAHERRLAVAKEYTSDTLVLTGTLAGRDALNGLIRERMVKEGAVDAATARTYELRWSDKDGVPTVASRELAVGDRVTFLQNEYRRYDVRNGEVGTVTRTAENGMGVRLADGREVSLDLEQYAALDYGYALTTYKSQGQTYDKVVVEADTRFAHLQDQRNSYVQLTRAREDVKIFTDDRESLREAAAMLGHKRDTLDMSDSLAQAVGMEFRVRRQALGLEIEKQQSAKEATSEKEMSIEGPKVRARSRSAGLGR